MDVNNEIRRAARAAGIAHWKIAYRLGVTEATFCRWLRKPLPEDKAAAIMKAIRELEQEAT